LGQEALVADLERVAQRSARPPFGQKLQETAEIDRIEPLERRQLPQNGAELFAELQNPALQEPVDRLAGLGQLAAVDRCAMRLDREHEILRRGVSPFGEARRRL